MTLRFYFAVAASFIVSACGPNVLYKGKVYQTPEEYMIAYDENQESVIRSIQPLQGPVSHRRLIVTVPSYDYFVDQKYEYGKSVGSPFNRFVVSESYHTKTPYNDYENTYRRIEKKGIFKSVEKRIIDGRTDILPSDDFDVLSLFVASSQGARDQWYYVSKRNGRQIVSFDAGKLTDEERVESFLDSIKAAAIQ